MIDTVYTFLLTSIALAAKQEIHMMYIRYSI